MLTLKLDKQVLRPGEKIAGEVAWEFERAIAGVEVRLFWMRAGLGEPETMTVAAQKIPCGSAFGSARFEFDGPTAPYSYLGSMFSIDWQIEAATEPVTNPALESLTIAPKETHVFMRPNDAIADIFRRRA